jgi:hypothetical protein
MSSSSNLASNPMMVRDSPFRRPQWRCERVLDMIARRPNPLRARLNDDHYVKAYRRFLLDSISAGTDNCRRASVRAEYPDVACAHAMHFSPDLERKQILEARLLTAESLEKIAQRFAVSVKAVEYFEALFFQVRDRLKNDGWIRATILRPPPGAVHMVGMTAEQRGYAYRLFAYFGGPPVLDAVIGAMKTGPVPGPEDVGNWLDGALVDGVRIRAVIAASVMPIHRRNAVRFVKWAARLSIASAHKGERKLTDLDRWIETVVSSFTFGLAERAPGEPNHLEQRVQRTPIEPRAEEGIAIANDIMPESLQQALERYESTGDVRWRR